MNTCTNLDFNGQMNENVLKYLKRSEIDDKKWDATLANAGNSRFYAQIAHLDRVTDNWDALVYGDYEFIMPLPCNRKLGIKYVFQPLFAQQLGIFPNPDEEIARLFYTELIRKFSYAEIQINAENLPFELNERIHVIRRQNFILHVGVEYSILQNRFSTNTKRNISKAQKNNLSFVAGIRLEEFLDFKIQNLPVQIEKRDIQRLKSIIAYGQFKGFGEIFGVYTAENKLCAAVFFVRWKNRIIYMNAASSQQGKELGGMYFLLYNFINANAGKNFIIDFEGSTIPGLARFYRGFGAIPETYFQLKFNRLPLPLRWFKR